MKLAPANGFKWICLSARTGSRKPSACRNREFDRPLGSQMQIARERRGEKNMNRVTWASCFLSSALLLTAASVRAQDDPPPPPPDAPPPGGMMHGEGPGGPFADRVELMGFEGFHGNKIVKGAPFSATAATETSQILQDGTAIHRSTTSTLYRDSQG